ncbi:MAG: hypothetical protein QW331_04200, partial [Candidatus Woesearchaeota archaeon]
MGDISYEDLRVAKVLQDKGFTSYDEVQGRSNIIRPFHILLSIFQIEIGARILPFVFGIIAAILFYLFIKNNETEEISFFITAIFIFSPAFIYTFITSTKESLAFVLLLTTLFLLLKFSGKFFYIAIFLGILLPYFSPIAAIASVPLFFFFKKSTKEKITSYFVMGATILSIFLFPESRMFLQSEQNVFNIFITDFAAPIGFALFSVILAAIGLFSLLKRRKTVLDLIWPGFVLVLLTIFVSIEFNIYLNILISFFAGYGFYYLLEREWNLHFIRQASIFLLVCGLIFSTFSYVNRISNDLPNENIRESMLKIKAKTSENEVVFSHPSKSLWINYFAERKAYPDRFLFDSQKNKTFEIVK